MRLLLVNRVGDIVKTLHCDRLFGRIQHHGVWYRSQHKQALPHVYIAEETT